MEFSVNMKLTYSIEMSSRSFLYRMFLSPSFHNSNIGIPDAFF